MSRVFARTIGQRIRIRWCDDASEKCRASSLVVQPSVFFPPTPQSTTRSTSSATSSPAAPCACSEPMRRSNGSERPPLHEPRRISAKLRLCSGSRDMCGRPFWRKKILLDRWSAWSGADMCTAFDAARCMPRARMGVRGSGPIQRRALEALCHGLVFLTPSHRPLRHPLLRSSWAPTASQSRALTRPQLELDKSRPWPSKPR
jgi:hypothetical protein